MGPDRALLVWLPVALVVGPQVSAVSVALVVGIMVARLGRFARPSPPSPRTASVCATALPIVVEDSRLTASMVDYRAKAIRDGSRIHASDSISCWI